ncbi:hypothetical protein NDU88_005075 [Pleurodeles waltl]|uniref:Uncharacterized protein n=1 Tax=Pleurodeles waltl TaxID=8319 RepID=A0AAV7NVJ7_PLEWA|nr:hypothetical protein NDU88_005075 [Pleurodeles waltl]
MEAPRLDTDVKEEKGAILEALREQPPRAPARGTSGAGLSDLEEPATRRRIKGKPGTAGLLKGPGDQGEEAAAVNVVTAGAEEEGRTDREVGQQGFFLKAAQRTGQLGGSNTLKPATLWESAA